MRMDRGLQQGFTRQKLRARRGVDAFRARPRASQAATSASTRASSQPSSGAIAGATRRRGLAVARQRPRREQPEPRAAQQHVADACAPARGAPRARPRPAGRAGRRRRSAGPARRARRRSRARRGRRGRSARPASRRRPRARPRRAAARRPRSPGRAGSRACGTARRAPRARRARSTAIFAIRRHVVSLPPVIVTIPLEVSYSSALREMSTDFFGSPVEISGRTPA